MTAENKTDNSPSNNTQHRKKKKNDAHKTTIRLTNFTSADFPVTRQHVDAPADPALPAEQVEEVQEQKEHEQEVNMPKILPSS